MALSIITYAIPQTYNFDIDKLSHYGNIIQITAPVTRESSLYTPTTLNSTHLQTYTLAKEKFTSDTMIEVHTDR